MNSKLFIDVSLSQIWILQYINVVKWKNFSKRSVKKAIMNWYWNDTDTELILNWTGLQFRMVSDHFSLNEVLVQISISSELKNPVQGHHCIHPCYIPITITDFLMATMTMIVSSSPHRVMGWWELDHTLFGSYAFHSRIICFLDVLSSLHSF